MGHQTLAAGDVQLLPHPNPEARIHDVIGLCLDPPEKGCCDVIAVGAPGPAALGDMPCPAVVMVLLRDRSARRVVVSPASWR